MREILNDKKDIKSIILDRVDEQIAAEVWNFVLRNFFKIHIPLTERTSMKMNMTTLTTTTLLVLKNRMHTTERKSYVDHLLSHVFCGRKWKTNQKKKKNLLNR